jgi:methionyl-tRNA formyltransferase
LSVSGAELLVATMDGIAEGILQPRPQGTDGVSIAPRIVVDDARVPWDAPAQHVDRLVRACTPAPGAWTTFRGERLKLGPVRLSAAVTLAPGQVAVGKDGVLVGTSTSAVELGTVQPAGKRSMAAADWARGVRPGAAERCE